MDVDCARDELSLEDWIILEKIKSSLKKLKITTKALKLLFIILNKVLLAIVFVLV